MSAAPGKRPLAKKPSSANAKPKAEAPKLQKIRSDGYVKPAAAAADAAEAKAAKAANKAARGEKQLEDVSDSPHREQLEALFETLDSNQTGSLSLDEFQQFLESIQCKHTREQARAAMKHSKKGEKENAPGRF